MNKNTFYFINNCKQAKVVVIFCNIIILSEKMGKDFLISVVLNHTFSLLITNLSLHSRAFERKADTLNRDNWVKLEFTG